MKLTLSGVVHIASRKMHVHFLALKEVVWQGGWWWSTWRCALFDRKVSTLSGRGVARGGKLCAVKCGVIGVILIVIMLKNVQIHQKGDVASISTSLGLVVNQVLMAPLLEPLYIVRGWCTT